MMWGRKAKRIVELEQELQHAKNNLAVARVVTGAGYLTQNVVVEKGMWYRISYQFQHTGSKVLRVADLILEPVGQPITSYFDGDAG